ncbi:MAG: molybdopterin-dependent oxidoreductase [Desulfuromonadales bacterium]|nr:molybdopterin-dependent oxidoreductase [Desulfuromonadales bacterium]
MTEKAVRSICFEAGCHARCGVLVEVAYGRVLGIRGDKDHPFSRGFTCPKGRATRDVIYHPERITRPQLRVGAKHSGRFESVSWDTALGHIADQLLATRQRWGAEALVFGAGTVRGLHPHLNRFLALFGSPNFFSPINMSGGPLIMGSALTCGLALLGPDYGNTRCVTLWGHNPEMSFPGLYMNEINQALSAGAKLIVVDPRGTRLAQRADHWLQIRPGTDTALALGLIHVIIREELYHQEFVANWTVGFDRLREHVQTYTPERCARITGIAAGAIEAAAITFGQAESAAMGPGMGMTCQLNNAIHLGRALTILTAITGNLEVPGGMPNYQAPTGDRCLLGSHFDVCLNLPKEQADKQLARAMYPLWNFMPLPIPAEAVWPAMLEGKPYPVKAAGLWANNALCAYANSKMVKEALSTLDFLFCVDFFHTPTTALADVILPPAHWTERDEIEDAIMKNHVFAQPKVVEPVGECRSEKQILTDLAARMGFDGYWGSVEESINYRLEPFGLDWEKLKELGHYSIPVVYRSYEKNGFQSGSGKVELYSELLQSLGYAPLPEYEEPFESPVSTPELYREYPLVLTTGGRNVVYYHSALRNVPALRKLAPDPELQIHPETARELNIEDGEWIFIETVRGRVEHRARYFEGLAPGVVHAPHGYWYGKDDSLADREDGWKRYNINQITDNQHRCDATAGVPCKAMLCRIGKLAGSRGNRNAPTTAWQSA